MPSMSKIGNASPRKTCYVYIPLYIGFLVCIVSVDGHADGVQRQLYKKNCPAYQMMCLCPAFENGCFVCKCPAGSSASGSSPGSGSIGSNPFSNFHPGQFPALSGNLSTNGTSSGSIGNSSGSGSTSAGATSVSIGGSGSGSLGLMAGQVNNCPPVDFTCPNLHIDRNGCPLCGSGLGIPTNPTTVTTRSSSAPVRRSTRPPTVITSTAFTVSTQRTRPKVSATSPSHSTISG